MDETGEKTAGVSGKIQGGKTTMTVPIDNPLSGQVGELAANKGGEVKKVAGGQRVDFVGKPIETTLSTGVRIVDVPPGTPQSEVMKEITTKGGKPAVGSSADYEGGIKGGQRFVLPPKNKKP